MAGRGWRIAVVALLAAGGLVGCAENKQADDGAGGATAGTGTEIGFGVGVDPAYSPIYLADQNGLFKQAGLQVKVKQFQEGTGGLDAILAKQGQVSANTESSMLNRAARGNLKALAVFSQSPDFIKLVARKGVDDVKDIKKYGVVAGTVNEFATNKVLAANGIDRDSVEFVKSSPAEMPALLGRGDIDGYIMWEPWPSRGVAGGGKVLLTSGDVGYVYNLVITVDGGWYEANKDEAASLVKVIGQACDQITGDAGLAGTATEKAIKVPSAEARTLLKGVQCKVRDFTADDVKRYGEISEFQRQNKIVDAKVDVDSILVRGVA
ncbi:ABC transporter substrate-binding protein [Actinomadura viridis]|uniref:NitT/TauT family transport system substrate-binding protein n=1 Tax=Actinomadura viridis TaxID=58110 RepID=A0A931DHZ3_9ACTN|nr:ABC transporter substrate-binding protein [Actinomadura viridis]MBG6091529.1 NitT/TauT family transport system substrate-binding protein [Actinomadura viridis]